MWAVEFLDIMQTFLSEKQPPSLYKPLLKDACALPGLMVLAVSHSPSCAMEKQFGTLFSSLIPRPRLVPIGQDIEAPHVHPAIASMHARPHSTEVRTT